LAKNPANKLPRPPPLELPPPPNAPNVCAITCCICERSNCSNISLIRLLNSNLPVLTNPTIVSSMPLVVVLNIFSADLAALVALSSKSSNALFQPKPNVRCASRCCLASSVSFSNVFVACYSRVFISAI